MSDVPPPSGGPGPGPGGPDEQISEEELRAYLARMREAPVGELIAQVISALLNGAQVKVGRRDARLLIDLAGTVAETAAPHLDDGFNREVSQVLAQLRLAQVDGEQQIAEAAAAGQDVRGGNDLANAPTTSRAGTTEGPGSGGAGVEGTPASPPPEEAPSQAAERSRGSSRLWLPGQG